VNSGEVLPNDVGDNPDPSLEKGRSNDYPKGVH